MKKAPDCLTDDDTKKGKLISDVFSLTVRNRLGAFVVIRNIFSPQNLAGKCDNDNISLHI